ncbi:hypothetical protein Agub_g14496, partial [Astrephomene gubernaculifera]
MAKGKGKSKAAKKSGGPRAPAAQLTPRQLYERALLALRYDDFDSARTAMRKAVSLDPDNIEYLDAFGALLAEVGPAEEAIQVLRRAVALSPDAGFEKYLYLGQLLEEEPDQALEATRRGVGVLQAQHAAAVAASSPDVRSLSRTLTGALCSLCEMIMGQGAAAAAEAAAAAAGGGGAEAGGEGLPAAAAAEVEHLLALASTADPSSPEPAQALAALRYQQGRSAEALEALRRSMSLWYTPSSKEAEEGEEGEGQQAGGAGSKGGDDETMEDAGEEGDNEEEGDDDEEAEEQGGPSYEFRIECAKLLLELEDTTATAIDVLEGLIEEDDRVPETWHLLALAYYSGHQYGEAAEVLGRGQALLA